MAKNLPREIIHLVIKLAFYGVASSVATRNDMGTSRKISEEEVEEEEKEEEEEEEEDEEEEEKEKEKEKE